MNVVTPRENYVETEKQLAERLEKNKWAKQCRLTEFWLELNVIIDVKNWRERWREEL